VGEHDAALQRGPADGLGLGVYLFDAVFSLLFLAVLFGWGLYACAPGARGRAAADRRRDA
jgi:hypothetical protein